MTNTEPTTYAEAQAELESLVAAMQQPTVDIDAIAARVERAKFLIDWSQRKLRATEDKIDTLLGDPPA